MKGGEWLTGLDEKRIVPGLRNITELMARLGDPQNDYGTVHVAGSDGKGSVCEMMYSALLRSGIRAGKFSSPYIEDRNESISVDGEPISDADLDSVLTEVREKAEAMGPDYPCTFFEVLTAAAYLWFSRCGVEYAVIETGMGGTLDATNVIVPDVAVITNVSMEHTRFLGSTLREIASHKAGIIKAGVPTVTSAKGEALDVIRARASELGSNLIVVSPAEQRSMDVYGSDVVYKGEGYRIGIPGSYQCENMALAVEALRKLPIADAVEDHIREGLREARLPGRMEKILQVPLVVDGTHTVAGMTALCRDIKELYDKVLVVTGMLSDKNIDGMMSLLSGISDGMIITAPDSERALPADELGKVASKYLDEVIVIGDERSALDYAMEIANVRTILVTGSFRMVEGAKRWLRTRSARYST